jgi:hypothetical protein
MTRKGPTLVNHRMAKDAQVACASLIRALELQPSERCAFNSEPPPPAPLKVRKAGGQVRNHLAGITSRAVDLGASILTVEEVCPGFWTPPPPLKGRKAGGGPKSHLCR